MSSNNTQVCGKRPREDKEYDSDDFGWYGNRVNDHPYVNNTDDTNTKDDDATTGTLPSPVPQDDAYESDEEEVHSDPGTQSPPSPSSAVSSSRGNSPILASWCPTSPNDNRD